MFLYAPKTFFFEICRRHGVVEVELGIYRYVPQCVEDHRLIRRVSLKNFDAAFEKARESLPDGHDIAIHSRVTRLVHGYRRQYHIPMIDLAQKELTADSIQHLQEIATDFNSKSVGIFSSGRSFHVYFDATLPKRTWITFMGRCLLSNRQDSEQLVDARWIGHRLMAGYCSLRWTRRNNWYVGDPSLVRGSDFNIMKQQSTRRSKQVTIQPWLFPASA